LRADGRTDMTKPRVSFRNQRNSTETLSSPKISRPTGGSSTGDTDGRGVSVTHSLTYSNNNIRPILQSFLSCPLLLSTVSPFFCLLLDIISLHVYFPKPSAQATVDDPTDCPQGHVNRMFQQPLVSTAACFNSRIQLKQKYTLQAVLRLSPRFPKREHAEVRGSGHGNARSADMHSSVAPIAVMHGLRTCTVPWLQSR